MTHSSQIHLYRPQRTRPEDLEAVFVGRELLVEEILGTLGQWKPSGSRQHYLLIGPRGIGKTCLLQIVQHRIRTGPLAESCEPIVLSEEGYALRSVANLLIEALKFLVEQRDDADVREAYEKVRHDADDQRATDLALDAFRRFHQRTGQCILLMLENVNRILDRQMRRDKEIHLLRKILIEEDWLVLLATSPTYVNAVAEPAEPLFEFFRVKQLGEFSRDEQVLMLRKLAALEGNADFEEYLREFRSRLNAIYHFTGGNPRLAVMLYDLIVHQRLRDVHAELDSLLDQLTPFYQDRMGDLAAQEAQLLEQMALLPEGCTPTELAREARMPAKTVRSLLGRLADSGYVRREERRKKQTVYIIPERFFRIWHQLTHSRGARGRVQYLVEFFSTWYASREERDHVWQELSGRLDEGVAEEDDDRVEDIAEYMQYIIAVSKGQEKCKREFEALCRLVEQGGVQAIEEQLGALDHEYKENPDYFMEKGCFFAEIVEDHQRALSAFDEAVRLEPREPIALFDRAVALDKLGNPEAAKKTYKTAALCLTQQKAPGYSEETERLLLRTLRDVNEQGLVQTAANLLGRFGKQATINEVISILRDSEVSWRRRHCVAALALIGGERAIESLLSLLVDEASEVRSSAANALGRLGSEAAVDPLIECLSDGASNVRSEAATALGRLRSEAAANRLIECLSDEAGEVRGRAAAALGGLGFEAAAHPLMECLSDEANNVRACAAAALGRLGFEATMVPLIECLSDKEVSVRTCVATALGRLGSDAAVRPLIKCLSDKSVGVRTCVAMALGRLGSEAAVGPLIKCLSDKGVGARARGVAHVLGHLRSEEAVGPLIACLSDKAKGVRTCAAAALGRLGSDAAVRPLIECLSDESNNVRASAAYALGQIGSGKAVQPLLGMVTTRSRNERNSALTALGRIAVHEPVPRLSEILALVLDELSTNDSSRVEIGQQMLRSAFRSANLEMVHQSINVVLSRIEETEDVFAPHLTALKYLDSGRDPAVLERQHPEMREAAQLLVMLFDGEDDAQDGKKR